MILIDFDKESRHIGKLFLFDPKTDKIISSKHLDLGDKEKITSLRVNQHFGVPFYKWKGKVFFLIHSFLEKKLIPHLWEERICSKFLLATLNRGKLIVSGFTLDHDPGTIDEGVSPNVLCHPLGFAKLVFWKKAGCGDYAIKDFRVANTPARDQHITVLKF